MNVLPIRFVFVVAIMLLLFLFSRASGQLLARASSPQIWISAAELAQLPTYGEAWDDLLAEADTAAGNPNLGDQNDRTNVTILAKALVYARTGQTTYRDDVVAALDHIVQTNTEENGTSLALSRELAAYVIAADLIDLTAVNPALDTQFRAKLTTLLTKNLSGRTLRSTHEDRPNNWGTHAGASRAAVALYLGDATELANMATVFHGWLGNRAAYAAFDYGDDLSWQCNPAEPVGINPLGCLKSGQSLDGAQPEEMRRAGGFTWPPEETTYAWEGLQGAVVQAEILARAGYSTWAWEDEALLRAVQFLYGIGWQAEGDDRWQTWIVNKAYGQTFVPEAGTVHPGKNMGWTNWTHGPAWLNGLEITAVIPPNTNDVQLGWPHIDEDNQGDPLTVTTYEIWQHEVSYERPDEEDATRLATLIPSAGAETVTYLDDDILALVEPVFYTVRAKNGSGYIVGDSRLVGALPFVMRPGE
ncbi:MAG: alginate lyase family protein [Chloroflexota bacterium]